MGYRLVLDENIEHSVLHRLDNAGHDVEHVDFMEKGASDTTLAQYALREDRIIVTYDDDFVVDIDESDYKAVLLFEDQTMAATEVAQIIQEMAAVYLTRGWTASRKQVESGSELTKESKE